MQYNEWLEWRLDGIGGSDAPVIMGVSPWKSYHKLWVEKATRVYEDIENEAMRRGKALEEPARQKFEEMLDVIVFPKTAVHPDFHYMRASIDGIDIEGKIGVEIKNANKEDHAEAKSGRVPEKYYPQVQHCIYVFGLEKMYYFSASFTNGITGEGDFAIVDVPRDEKFLAEYLPKAKEFWDSVTRRIEPPRGFKDPIEFDSSCEDMLERAKFLKRRVKNDEKELDKIKEDLKKASNNMSAKGFGMSLSADLFEGRMDLEKLKLDYPNIDFEIYKKPPSVRWSLRETKG